MVRGDRETERDKERERERLRLHTSQDEENCPSSRRQ